MVRKLRGDDVSNQEFWGEITPVKQYLKGDRPYFTLFGPKSSNTPAASYPGQFALSELLEEAWNQVRQAWQVSSQPKSPRTTGNEADLPSDKYWLLP